MKVEDVVVWEEEERSLKDKGGKLESLVCLPASLPNLSVYSKVQESRSFQEWRLH